MNQSSCGEKTRLWTMAVIFGVTIAISSLIAICAIAHEYMAGQISNTAIVEAAGADNLNGDENSEDTPIDWETLRRTNSDVVAWVYIPDTPINYPVVQGYDNEEYLHRGFDGDGADDFGTVFLDCRNDPSMSDNINFLYAHHMIDGSMFASIAAIYTDGIDTAPYVYIYTPQHVYKLRTVIGCHRFSN